MKLALYVHDFRLEVGHSNSLIELVRHLPQKYLDDLEEIEVISYRSADLEELFPNLKANLRFVKVPFPGLKPSILISVFYQIWTLIYNTFFQSSDFYRIGIGVCCLDVHAVSVQFIHHQWTRKGLEMEQGHWLRKIYKKILFSYYEACENFVFSKKNLKVFSPAVFLTEFLKSKYPQLDAVTIYSGVNLERFPLNIVSKRDLLDELIPKYPNLAGLDIDRPIYLFVGAYERKGLYDCLDLLRGQKDAQFIVVGSPSFGRSVKWPENLKVFTISFTKEVAKFYALADTFIFPTIYEPFGLVLFEAMSMGLTIVTRRFEVGASELLEGLPEVYFTDYPGFLLPLPEVKDVMEKQIIRAERFNRLGDVSWNKAGLQLGVFLEAALEDDHPTAAQSQK